ncbi:MAG: hypothetical protein Q8N44_11090 [Rubrivivax sp.]|nr:hypothetical protein [Rubrivivax sp.]
MWLGMGLDAAAQAKPRIEKAADLPRFSYKVGGRLDDIVRSAERFAPLGAAIRRDTEGVLSSYEIPDKATRRELLTLLAVLDHLGGRHAAALERAEAVRALQDKPADKRSSACGCAPWPRRRRSMAPPARLSAMPWPKRSRANWGLCRMR